MSQDGKLAVLRDVPLFRSLDATQLQRLAEFAADVQANDGDVLMRQGESGDEFFVVVSGNVIVEREDQRLARLGPGDFLGEIALIDGRPRTATATADGAVQLIVLDHGQFEALLDEFPGIGRQVARTLVDRIRRTVTVPQFGIFAQGTNAHAFMEWDLRPDVDPLEAASVLGRLRGPTVSAGGVNVVLAFGADLWRALAPRDVPTGLGPFQPVGRLGGHHAPATQHDLWLWMNGSSQDVVFEHTRAAALAIETVAQLANEQLAFVHRDSRDLTGFLDGTANPTMLEAPMAALVPDGQPGAGGSHVLAMRWVHDLKAFDTLSTWRVLPSLQRRTLRALKSKTRRVSRYPSTVAASRMGTSWSTGSTSWRSLPIALASTRCWVACSEPTVMACMTTSPISHALSAAPTTTRPR
jgi:Cyclic nucleotide-binding domain/Dyp-type peroxidase, C-terminal/Dyp-type peroxidase, N-terminal